jgi:L-asparagine transporter-like permease
MFLRCNLSPRTSTRCIWRGRIYFCVCQLACDIRSIKVQADKLPNSRSSIKVITITGLIILGIVLDLGGMFRNLTSPVLLFCNNNFVGGPNHDRLGFRNWKNPGPFVQFAGIAGSKGRFLGFWAVLTQAAFSYIGTEIVAVSINPNYTRTNNIQASCCRLPLVRPKTQGVTSQKQSKGFISVS